jgi:hypothetical protein
MKWRFALISCRHRIWDLTQIVPLLALHRPVLWLSTFLKDVSNTCWGLMKRKLPSLTSFACKAQKSWLWHFLHFSEWLVWLVHSQSLAIHFRSQQTEPFYKVITTANKPYMAVTISSSSLTRLKGELKQWNADHPVVWLVGEECVLNFNRDLLLVQRKTLQDYQICSYGSAPFLDKQEYRILIRMRTHNRTDSLGRKKLPSHDEIFQWLSKNRPNVLFSSWFSSSKCISGWKNMCADSRELAFNNFHQSGRSITKAYS